MHDPDIFAILEQLRIDIALATATNYRALQQTVLLAAANGLEKEPLYWDAISRLEALQAVSTLYHN